MNYEQIINNGFIKRNLIPKKYRTKDAVFWFVYYGTPYVNEIAELHARTKINVGNPKTLKIFRYKSKNVKNRKLFIKARQLEFT